MTYEVIQNEEVIGTSESIVHITYGKNEAYQECKQEDANGFCVKLVKEFLMEDGAVEVALVDTVFALPDHTLRGDEPEAEYREVEA